MHQWGSIIGSANKGADRSETKNGRDTRGGKPLISLNEGFDSEPASLCGAVNDPVTRPGYPCRGVRTRSPVLILTIIERAQREIPRPLEPTGRIDQISYQGVHIHGSRILFHWSAEVVLERSFHGDKISCSSYLAALDGNSSVLIWILPTLRSEYVRLIVIGLAGVKAAVLQHNSGVAEDEVDGAVDIAFAVELPERVDVEGILVADETAPVEDGEVRAAAQCHRLLLAWSRRVLE